MDNTAKSHSKAIAPKQSECKKMRYSIRKVATVGATSALVGTLAFLGVSHVKADQVTETASSVATTTTEKSTVFIALASETETSTATSEVVNSSSTHSEVETTVTTSQSSKTSSLKIRRLAPQYHLHRKQHHLLQQKLQFLPQSLQ